MNWRATDNELPMNPLSATPSLRSRAAALALGSTISLCLMAVMGKLWLFLFTKVAGGFLLALVWLLIGAIYRRGFRWFFSRRALRSHGCVVAGAISLIVLFYVEEGWRGKRAWTALQLELASRGEKLDVASVTPPPVPDDQNLAMAPVMARLLAYETNSSGRVRTPSVRRPGDALLERPLPAGSLRPVRIGWPWSQFTDLEGWQTYFRLPYETTRWSVKSNRFTRLPAEPLFPVAAEPQTAAQDVLLALSRFSAVLEELARAAKDRPLIRYPQPYDLGYFGENLAGLQRLRDLVQVLCLRADARLREGQVAPAFADVQLALRLADSPREEPWLYSRLGLRYGMLTHAIQPIWEGLASHQWTEPQLAELEQHFARLNLLAEQLPVLRGETAMHLDLIHRVRQVATGAVKDFNPLHGTGDGGDGFWLFVLRWFYPVGWLYQDEVLTCGILFPFDATVRGGERPAQPALSTIMDPFFVTFLVPRLRAIREEVETQSPRAQTIINQALVACALERYRLAHGQFPDHLESLVPQFVAALPRDVASGQPLRYRRTDDDRFVLYAIGSDGVDDSGKPAKVELDWTGSPIMRSGPGDWVWSYPPAIPRTAEPRP